MKCTDKIVQQISEKWDFLKQKTVFVAVSGGVDSMVLVSILHHLKFRVEILHVNYQLRGQDSDADEEFVRSFCKRNSIPFHLKKVKYSEGNVQNWAREIRYDWFESFLNLSENNVVALAHHSDDQVETFFLQLLRGGGMMGLSGMLENRNRIIRPLLPFSKKEILAVARDKNIEWREDLSNQSLKYARNRWRNELIPKLKSDFPNLSKSVLTIMNVFQRNQAELSEKMSFFVVQLIQNKIIELEEVRKWNSFEWTEILRQIGVSATQLDEIKKIVELEKGKFVELNHPDFSAFVREKNGISLRKNILKSYRLKVHEVKEIPTKFNKNEIYLDKHKIAGKLSIRLWQAGDRIAPVGMNGTQLVSDVIRLAKLSDIEKRNCWVVEDEAQIHWVVGLKIGRMAIATSGNLIVKCSVHSK